SNQDDELIVDSTHLGTVRIDAAGGADLVRLANSSGLTDILLGPGDDHVQVNYFADGTQTDLDGVGALLTLNGEGESDIFDIALSGTGSSLIDVFDTTSPTDGGVDALNIYGTPLGDYFLVRANNLPDADPADRIGSISSVEVDENREPVENARIERVNYRSDIEGGVRIFARDGDDTVVLDDTLAPIVVYGDAGADTFQIGQVFASPRDGTNPDHGLSPDEFFQTTPITRGFLSNGISHSSTIFGGKGNDSFTVYRNLAELFLFGDEDDDNFVVRAFVKVDPNDPKAPYTNINGGQGADFIAFTVNAPVRIEGGDGFDTLTVIGTEFGDDFVVTESGVFGGGLFITYGGLEKVEIDALEGNDRFFIESTNENVVVEIIGGLGSDTFNVSGGTGDEPIEVVSNGLEGHSGIIQHLLSSVDGRYHDVFVRDQPVKVADNDEAGIVITPIKGALRVFEETLTAAAPMLVASEYSVVLTRSPRETVRVAASPIGLSESVKTAGGKNLLLNGLENGTTLFFDRTNWFIPQIITVSTPDDALAQGNRTSVIQHKVIEGVSADDRGAYDNLAVLSVPVEVIDNDSASVVIVQSNDDTTVAENASGDLPASDQYYILLSQEPRGDVTLFLNSDDLQLTDVSGDSLTDQTFTFSNSDWANRLPQTITVSAFDDELAEGVHYARIQHNIADVTSQDNFLNLNLKGLVDNLGISINGDTGAGYTAEIEADLTGTLEAWKLSVKGPAFKADGGFITLDTEGDITAQVVPGSTVAAYTEIELTVSGSSQSGPTPFVAGDVWNVRFNGKGFVYVADGNESDRIDPTEGIVDSLDVVTKSLADLIDANPALKAAANGKVITVSIDDTRAPGIEDGVEAFSYDIVDSKIDVDTDNAITSPDFVTEADILISAHSAGAAPTTGDVLSVNLGAVEFFSVAGSRSVTQPGSVDVRLLDDEAPGAFVVESGGDTKVTEPTDIVVLGEGVVSGLEGDTDSAVFAVVGDGTQKLRSLSSKIFLTGTPSLDTVQTAYFVLSGNVVADEPWSIEVTRGGGTPTTVRYRAADGDSLGDIANALKLLLVDPTAGLGMSEIPNLKFVQLTGDFGVEPLLEGVNNNALFAAQNLELGKWSKNQNLEVGDATTLPYLTVKATGDGEADFFSFVVTEEMFATGSVPIRLDVDHGYESGDTIFWNSTVSLFDESGLLLDKGFPVRDGEVAGSLAGSEDPLDVGGDAFLSFVLPQPATPQDQTFIVKVDSVDGAGLAVGVDYDLHVSVSRHSIADFVFGPEPIFENESEQDPDGDAVAGAAQNIDSAEGFFTFADPDVGNGQFNLDPRVPDYSGFFDFTTPYARIAGSGDGSFDLYEFNISEGQLAPIPVDFDFTSKNDESTIDDSDFFTSVDFTLNGRVSAGDQWTLGVRYRDYQYVAKANDTLDDVADGLKAELVSNMSGPARFSGDNVVVTYAADSDDGKTHFSIVDDRGFQLEGLTADGLSQFVNPAGVVLRQTSAKTRPDDVVTGVGDSAIPNADILFTTVDVVFAGTVNDGERWTLRVDNADYHYDVENVAEAPAKTIADVISGIKGQLPTGTYNLSDITDVDDNTKIIGFKITKIAAGGSKILASIQGASPTGEVTLFGTPVSDQIDDIDYREVRYQIADGDVKLGETWQVTLAGTLYDAVVTNAGSAHDLALSLKADIENEPGNDFVVTVNGGTLEVHRDGENF
ncbi:MAG: hypothetical protein ACI9HK_004525, partial [Pirellulaceae bacterium]